MTRVALSFDDGPGPATAAILDTLAAAGVAATFFILGRNLVEAPWTDPPGDVAQARALVARARREGHVVGNHTYSHFRREDWAQFPADVLRGEAALRDAGIGGPLPFRLPYGPQIVDGALDPRLAMLASFGKTHVHWTGDFSDWTVPAGGAAELAARMIAHVEAQAAAGLDAVLDLHDSGTGRSGYDRFGTAGAVALFVDEARRRGWPFFTVPE